MLNSLIKTVVIVLCLSTSVLASPIHLVDGQGRSVVLPKPAERIVTTFTPANLFSLSLGLADKLVGVGGNVQFSPFLVKMLENQKPVFVGSRSAGNNLESIIGLQPDLVLIHGKKDGYRLADRLAGLGIPCIVMQPESFAEADQVLQLIAKATGTQAKAKVIQTENARIKKIIESRLAGLTKAERIKAYYVNSSDLYRTASKQMFQHELMTLAGVDNVAKDIAGFYPKINSEQLMLWQPQLLIRETNNSTKVDEQLADTLVSSLSSLPQIRLPAGSFWDMPSPMATIGALYIAAHAYPERFKDIDVDAETANYYRVAFGNACLSPMQESATCP
ncbi:ABC transporter substrate-binding protein [Shewanella intestini]|uniref:ABC transporter substrate-binding protein n=1 Tax=Shewanella intestini TaxID=2017544 RepID=A0ABS5HYU4_9GAMM|nr:MULTISPECIES: ABC transporter substrate-binding protein [Shewanella]MBR9726901.1 ABC transporter substrate-binding protein [Shewanella intestini]MRG34533.1 ABC transporter substrate-binding protein [Shewanella sp. XMDDZSB0408]